MQQASVLDWLREVAFVCAALEILFLNPLICLFALVAGWAGYAHTAERLRACSKITQDFATFAVIFSIICFFLRIGLLAVHCLFVAAVPC